MSSQKLEILGIIGARSGSKGVPHKNIKHLAGKPLVGRIIETAKKSKHLTRLIVSTDSDDYAVIARAHGAETPFKRPPEVSTDTSDDIEFIAQAVRWLKENEGYRPDIVVRCVGTVPLQLTEDIDACIEALLNDPKADSAVVITEASQHPTKALKLIDDGNGGIKLVSYVTGRGRDAAPFCRQNVEKAYVRANITATRIKTLEEKNSLTGDLVRYHIIPQTRSVDIDSPIDFFIADFNTSRYVF